MASEERLGIARELVVSTPPGQLEVILKDLEVILGASGEPLTAAQTAQLRGDYREQQHHHAEEQEATRPEEPPLAGILFDELVDYKNKRYSSKGVVASFTIASQGSGSVLTVRSYAERLDVGNCHAGCLSAKWVIDNRTIVGDVRMHTVYHESGFTQLRTSRSFGPEIVAPDANDDESVAKGVVSQISAWEKNFIESLGTLQEDMGTNLKSLRRVLPITRKKLDWTVHAHRMAKTLGDTASTTK